MSFFAPGDLLIYYADSTGHAVVIGRYEPKLVKWTGVGGPRSRIGLAEVDRENGRSAEPRRLDI